MSAEKLPRGGAHSANHAKFIEKRARKSKSTFVSNAQLARDIEEGSQFFWKSRGGRPQTKFKL